MGSLPPPLTWALTGGSRSVSHFLTPSSGGRQPRERHPAHAGAAMPNRKPSLDLRSMPGLVQHPNGRQRAPLDPAFFVPFQHRLRSLYGSTPHRISHLTAMSMARVAIQSGFALDVSGPPVDPETAKRLKVFHREEPGETLVVGANPWHGSTWISQPERALLECLQDSDRLPDGETVGAEVLYRGEAVVTETVIEIAHRLGWDKPLRRLASIADRMDNCRGVFSVRPDGFLHDNQRLFLDVDEAPSDSDWICAIPARHDPPPRGSFFLDEKQRVVWCWTHPHALLEDLLY